MAGPRDPFAPPPDDSTGAPLELAEVPSQAWPMREDETPPPVRPAAPRQPVKYKNPSSSANVVVFSFALIGLIAVIGFGVGTLRRSAATQAAARRAPRPAEPAKPILWKALDKGDAVLVTIEVTPRSAQLLLDGEPLPSNPARVPRGSAPLTLTATADGHEPASETLVPDAPKTVKLRLSRAR